MTQINLNTWSCNGFYLVTVDGEGPLPRLLVPLPPDDFAEHLEISLVEHVLITPSVRPVAGRKWDRYRRSRKSRGRTVAACPTYQAPARFFRLRKGRWHRRDA